MREPAQKRRRTLTIVLALTTTFTVAEVVSGLLTGSLALPADAEHILSGNPSLGIALLAARLAGSPATPKKSFGYKRAEILATLAKGATLVAINLDLRRGLLLAYGSRRRSWADYSAGGRHARAPRQRCGSCDPSRSGGENLNAQGVLRHGIADALGSVEVMVAAVVIVLTASATLTRGSA